MKRILKRLGIALAVVLFGAGMAVAGWWFGFRDGFSAAYSEVGIRLSSYYFEDHSNDPLRTQRFLELYTAHVAARLLNVRHRFPIHSVNGAQAILMQLRATWQPDEKVFSRCSEHSASLPGRDTARGLLGRMAAGRSAVDAAQKAPRQIT